MPTDDTKPAGVTMPALLEQRIKAGRTRVPTDRSRHFLRVIACCKKRGEGELLELNFIAVMMAGRLPHLTAEMVVDYFVSSAKLGGFGKVEVLRGGRPNEIFRKLADFTSDAEPTQYSLHPSLLTVLTRPRELWARRTTWVEWLRAQGWPVPAELSSGLVIDHEPPQSDRRLIEHEPPPPPIKHGPAIPGRPPRPAPIRSAVAAWYASLSEIERTRSPYYLVSRYSGPGSEDHVRKVITELKGSPSKAW